MAEQGDQARSEDAMNTCRLVARRAHCSLLPTGEGQFRGDRVQRVTINCPKSGACKTVFRAIRRLPSLVVLAGGYKMPCTTITSRS